MKTITGIIILAVVLVGGYFIINSQKEIDDMSGMEGERVYGPEDVTLSVGETKDASGLSVALNAISEDSRCAIDVTCIWAGRVAVSVTLQGLENSATITISTDEPAVIFDGYAVSITSVSPEPISTVVLGDDDYRVTFHVAPVAEGSSL